MYVEINRNGRKLKGDRSYFHGYVNVWQMLAREALIAAGANPERLNTTLRGAADKEDPCTWSVVLNGDPMTDIVKLTELMSTAMAGKEGLDPKKLIEYSALLTTTTRLGNAMSRLGKPCPLSKDGPNSEEAPRAPRVNPDGGFQWLEAARTWGKEVVGDVPPDPSVLFDSGKEQVLFPYARPALPEGRAPTNEERDAMTRSFLTRDRLGSTFHMRIASLFTAVHLQATAGKDMWGTRPFGDNTEDNKYQNAAQIKRMISTRAIGLFWKTQPALVLAHAIHRWLFEGAGGHQPFMEELERTYKPHDVTALRTRLDAITSLSLARPYARLGALVGWVHKPSAWGEKPYLDVPPELSRIIDGGALADATLTGRGLLRDTSELMGFVDEMYDLVKTQAFSENYQLISGYMPTAPFAPRYQEGSSPYRPEMVISDGEFSSKAVRGVDLWTRPFLRTVDAEVAVGEDTIVVQLPRDPKVNPPPRISGPIATLDAAGRLWERTDPREWRPITEYQGDVGAELIPELTLGQLASRFAMSTDSLISAIKAAPAEWAHLFKLENGQYVPTAPSAFKSPRTLEVNRFIVTPALLSPALYFRWKEGRRLPATLAANVRTQARKWEAAITEGDVPLDHPVTAAVDEILKDLAVLAVPAASRAANANDPTGAPVIGSTGGQ